MHQERGRLEREVHREFPLVRRGRISGPHHHGQRGKGTTPTISALLVLGEKREFLGAGPSPGTGKQQQLQVYEERKRTEDWLLCKCKEYEISNLHKVSNWAQRKHVKKMERD